MFQTGGDLSATLKIASKSAYERELIDDSKTLSREIFLKPFRDDIDSRHEYKNPLENRAYNERECCFDQFSDLFKRFQSISRSDMNGSKTTEFWAELRRRGAEIIQLGDYNFNWFSELFVAMLLFYGPNMITSDSTDVPATIVKKKEHVSSTSGTEHKDLNKSKGKNNDGQNKQNTKAQLKHRKLEERLGAGKSYVNNSGGFIRAKGGIGLGSNRHNSTHSQTNGYNALIEEPAHLFPDHQQFFYRFIVCLDSHRLCEHLLVSIIAEIHRLSPLSSLNDEGRASGNLKGTSSQSQKEVKSNQKGMASSGIASSPGGHKESFLHAIVKLKILGKFLGLLHFWPHWTSLTDRSKMGPLLILIDEGARKRSQSKAPLDLYAIIEKSIRLSCLSLIVPWIVEYLRMMTWDSSFKVSNPHKEAISLLYHVYKSKQTWAYNDGKMSTNRLYVMMELESFVEWVPSSMILKLSSIPVPTETKLNAIDDQNLAFTKGFLRYVLPVLYDAWQRLHNRKSMAPSSRQTIDVSAPGSGIKPKQLKRQTPQLIKNRINSNSLTELASHPPFASPSSFVHTSNVSFSAQSNTSVPLSPGGKTQTSIISAQSSPAPSIGATNSKLMQSYSFSSPLSQSAHGFGDSNTNSPNNNNESNNNPNSDVTSRLVDSFWQQHPQLFQVSNFIIELHHSACHERLRDKTRAIIREYWARATDIKSEIKIPAPLNDDNLNKSVENLQNALMVDLNHIFSRCLKDGEIYLNELMEERMDRILLDLCSLYPCHQQVAQLGVKLITEQIKDQHGALLSIFGDYTKRKLDEVLHLSVQQFKKQSKESVNPPRKRKVQVGPSPPDWFDNEKLRNLFRRICKSVRISVRGSNAEEEDISLSADTTCSQWIDAFYKETCDFTLLEESTIIEGDEERSSIKLMNILASVAEDMVDIIFIVASKCSKERPTTSTAAANFTDMVIMLLRWAHGVINKVSPHIRDADGKIIVEMAKFFSVAFPVLIYVDFMCNEKFKATRTILVAEKNNLIFTSTVANVLAVAMRRNVLVFYENGKYIDNISVDYLDGTLTFVKGFLLEKGIELNIDEEDAQECSGYDSVNTEEMRMKIREKEDWLNDPSVMREVRSTLGQELAGSLVVLSNLIQQHAQQLTEQQQEDQSQKDDLLQQEEARHWIDNDD